MANNFLYLWQVFRVLIAIVLMYLAVFKDPPFKINELGYGGFNLPIEFYFKSEKEELRKAR